MPYIERDIAGLVKGTYNDRQPGYAEEWIAADHPEVLTFEAAVQAKLDAVKAQPSESDALAQILNALNKLAERVTALEGK